MYDGKRGWFFSAWTLIVLLPTGAAGSSLVWDHDARLGYDTASASQSPRWNGGALLATEGRGTANPVIRAFDRQGAHVVSVTLTIPEATSIVLLDSSTRGPNGVIASCGLAADREGKRSGFVALISADGQNIQIIRTSEYKPYHVAIAPDGTVWTIGLALVGGTEPPASRDEGVLRHFDRSGKIIGSFIPRSSMSSAYSIMDGYLVAAEDYIGWYAAMDFDDGPSTYFEISYDGTVRRRFPGVQLHEKERVTGFAATNDAGTFVTVRDFAKKTSQLLTADEAHGTWLPLPTPSRFRAHDWMALRGGDGNILVFWGADRFVLSFYIAAH